MSKEFIIRALNKDDWQDFRDIRLESLRNFPSNFGAHYADELRLEKQQWIDRIEDPKGKILGLFHSDTLISTNGVCTYRDDPSGKTALMIRWYMRSGYQGRGLFSDLVKAGIDWAEGQPRFDCIRVHHRDGNDASRKSNQKHGFIYTGREEKTWPDGQTVDIVMYERRFER